MHKFPFYAKVLHAPLGRFYFTDAICEIKVLQTQIYMENKFFNSQLAAIKPYKMLTFIDFKFYAFASIKFTFELHTHVRLCEAENI